jgi:hypothetical protein
MPVNREIWKVPFRDDSPDLWKCPTCRNGLIRLIPDKLISFETSDSKEARESDDWEYDWQRFTFSALFICTNKKCKEVIACVGESSMWGNQEYDSNGVPDINYEKVYSPKYFVPPLEVFPIPPKCPQAISSEIAKSFQLFLADPPSAANHIRQSIEEILNYLKVKRYERRRGKLESISLHRRIKIFELKNKGLADKLLAIKWLGNAGSHPGGVTVDDVLDAYDILEPIISRMFDPNYKDLEKIVTKINKQKGPLSKGQTA